MHWRRQPPWRSLCFWWSLRKRRNFRFEQWEPSENQSNISAYCYGHIIKMGKRYRVINLIKNPCLQFFSGEKWLFHIHDNIVYHVLHIMFSRRYRHIGSTHFCFTANFFLSVNTHVLISHIPPSFQDLHHTCLALFVSILRYLVCKCSIYFLWDGSSSVRL